MTFGNWKARPNREEGKGTKAILDGRQSLDDESNWFSKMALEIELCGWPLRRRVYGYGPVVAMIGKVMLVVKA